MTTAGERRARRLAPVVQLHLHAALTAGLRQERPASGTVGERGGDREQDLAGSLMRAAGGGIFCGARTPVQGSPE